jgi:hypothetical protein
MTDDNTIIFMAQPTKEVMRITHDRIFIAEGVTVDEATQGVIDALEAYVQNLVRRAVAAEREECANVCEQHYDEKRVNFTRDPYITTLQCAAAIRARGRQ